MLELHCGEKYPALSRSRHSLSSPLKKKSLPASAFLHFAKKVHCLPFLAFESSQHLTHPQTALCPLFRAILVVMSQNMAGTKRSADSTESKTFKKQKFDSKSRGGSERSGNYGKKPFDNKKPWDKKPFDKTKAPAYSAAAGGKDVDGKETVLNGTLHFLSLPSAFGISRRPTCFCEFSSLVGEIWQTNRLTLTF